MADAPSLGGAIGLNYKIPSSNFPAQLIMQQRQEEDAALKAANEQHRKAKEVYDRNKGELNKFVLDNQTGIIKNYQNDISAAAAEVMNVYNKNSAKHGYDYNPENDSELQNAKRYLHKTWDINKQSSDVAREGQKLALTQPDKYRLNPAYQKAFISGDYNDLINAINGPDAKEKHSVITGVGMLEAVDKDIDAYKLMQEAAQKVTVDDVTLENGDVTTHKIGLTPQKAESKWNNFETLNPKIVDKYIVQYKINKPQASDEEAYLAAKKFWIGEVKSVYSRKEDEAKKAGSGAGKIKVSASDITDLSMNVTTPDGKISQQKYRGVTLPKDFNLNTGNSQLVIDRATGLPLQVPVIDEKTGEQKKDENNKPIFKPFTGGLDITGGGQIVNDYKKLGGGTKKGYETSLWAKASVDFGGQTYKVDVSIPVKSIKTQEVLSGAKEAIDALEKEAESKNSEANKKTESKSSNADESQDSWNKKWASLKSGQKLVGLDGVTYTKK